MPLSYEQRLELLKKAREAKKLKGDARKQEKIDNPPPRGRPKKVVEERTLHIPETQPEPEIVSDNEPEIVEEITYEKIKKPKKKIVRKKIIQEYESDSGSEEEEIVTYVKPRREPKISSRIERPERDPEPPRIRPEERQPPPVTLTKNPFFSY
jgi:hypothetical protein